ncbi:fibronectin type III domain-containing protein, partial [Candidatus Woesearchaeota archaeon]|nr:fibronectin type III domain-containing protein [Candidatus Woesearchaeota archaeon]
MTTEYKPVIPTPPKITGLRLIRSDPGAAENTVEIAWNPISPDFFPKADDFSHYVIHRSDIGPIDIVGSIGVSRYTDKKVDSGASYAYQVSAVNRLGQESSERSEELRVDVPTGGKTGSESPDRVNIAGAIRTEPSVAEYNARAGEDFGISVPLNADGRYKITLQAFDKALNPSNIIEREVELDTVGPQKLQIIVPAKNSLIFENIANSVRIRGKTEPNAEVVLISMSFPVETNPTLPVRLDVGGLPGELQDIATAKLQSQCLASVCTANSMEATADESGDFVFDGVDLTPNIFGGARVTQVSAEALGQPTGTPSERKFAVLLFIAKDNSGLTKDEIVTVQIGKCSDGEYAWDVTTLKQYPFILSTDLIAEGSQSLDLFLGYEPIGGLTTGNSRVNDVIVTTACGSADVGQDERYIKGCRLLGGARGIPTRLNSLGTMSAHSVKLAPADVQEKTVEEWKGFVGGLGEEVTFPLKVDVRYTQEGVQGEQHQSSCMDVSYTLDQSLLNPKTLLPDWMLADFIGFLDTGADALKDANDKLRQAAKVAGYSCMGTYAIRAGTEAIRKIMENWEEVKLRIELATLAQPLPGAPEEELYCFQLKQKLSPKILSKENVLKNLRDRDMEKCFPSVYNWWKKEAAMYQAFRFSCDRLIGKSAPSRWTETETDDELKANLETNAGCPGDIYMEGYKPQPARKCYGNYAAYQHRI